MKNILRKVTFIVIILILLDFAAAFFWFHHVVRNEQYAYGSRYDVGIVLMGDLNRGTGELGNETLRRVEQGYALYKDRTIGHILCIGGARPSRNIVGSELMKEALIAKGVDGRQITAEKESNDSYSNWRMAKDIIRQFGWRKGAIISSPLHIQRVKRIILKEPLEDFAVSFLPYNYETAQPRLTLFEYWRQVHYEGASYVLNWILPKNVYRKLIQWMRK